MEAIVQQLTETLREANANKTPLRIIGGNTKHFYGNPSSGETLSTSAYRGIVDYEPTELVITARAGTPLAEIEAALKEKGQMLAFEPPHFSTRAPSPPAPLPLAGEGRFVQTSSGATLGGTIAAGLSGPRRPYAGAVRDLVLGIRMLDGNGIELRFGGRVMKNVAGYDVSRLMAGSLGTLGVILDVSLKTLPLPQTEITLHQQHNEADAIRLMNTWAGKPLPISATAWNGGDLGIRLSGAASAVAAARKTLGGDVVAPEQAAGFWQGIRDHRDPFFHSGTPLWRLSVKSTAPAIHLPGAQMIEWSGALRWFVSDADAHTVRQAAAAAGGHATLFRAADKSAGAFHPLSPALGALHRKLKQTFDPAGILNRGRIYSDI
ncbi:MAG: glycolate oxidase subunit GlcE [Betaproteobacteria bacterium]|nr:glycolate oxidase subunit GlcE [Betaproteobacteria bacterium]